MGKDLADLGIRRMGRNGKPVCDTVLKLINHTPSRNTGRIHDHKYGEAHEAHAATNSLSLGPHS